VSVHSIGSTVAVDDICTICTLAQQNEVTRLSDELAAEKQKLEWLNANLARMEQTTDQIRKIGSQIGMFHNIWLVVCAILKH
jgi:hypothetical protein